MSERLSPCPFCGERAAPQHYKPTELPVDWTWEVVCLNEDCGAVGPSTDTEQRAVRLWNERT